MFFGPVECGLNTLKFDLLDHFVDDVERFGTNQFLSSYLYEHFTFIVKQVYWSTSKPLETRTTYIFTFLNSNLKRHNVSNSATSITPYSSSLRLHGLVS